MTIFERIIAGLTILAVFAAVGNGCVIWLQVVEMRLDQRAWLGAKFGPLEKSVNGTVKTNLIFNNIGKTPAEAITMLIAIRIVPKGTLPDFRYPPMPEEAVKIQNGEPVPVWAKLSTGVIFPNDPTPMSFVMRKRIKGFPNDEDETWTQLMEDEFNHGDIFVDVHGKVSYKDAAGKHHGTKFCAIFSGPGIDVPLEMSKLCTANNNVDDEEQK